MSDERDIFQPYLEARYKQASALTFGQKLKVIEQLEAETKQGRIPISPDQVVKLNPESTAVRAVREGKQIALDGGGMSPSLGRSSSSVGKSQGNNTARRRAMIVAPLLLIVPLLLFGLWWFLPSDLSEEEISGTAVAADMITVTQEITPTMTPTAIVPLATATPPPTATPAPTFTPVSVEAASAYEVELNEDNTLADQINPVSLFFAGNEYQVTTAELEPEWEPEGVEWWPGTDIRRVFALPYQEALLPQIFAQMGEIITVRLRTGGAVQYRLGDIERVRSLQIEKMTSDTPSIALILYGEEGDERWFITGEALQGMTLSAESGTAVPTRAQIATVHSCQLDESNKISCRLRLTAEHYIGNLLITDEEWLEAIDHLPTGEMSQIEDLTVQIAGAVRTPNTAVLVWRNGDETVLQKIPSSVIQTAQEGNSLTETEEKN